MDMTVGRILKLIVIIAVLVVLGWLLVALSSTITILIISLLVAYILDPLVSFFEQKGLTRMQATTIVFLLIGVLTAGIISFFIPLLIKELQNIEQAVASGNAADFLTKLEVWLQMHLSFMDLSQLNLQAKLNEALSGLSKSIFSIIGSVVSIITALVIIPFAVFFFLKDGRHMKKALINAIPNRYFEMTLNLIYKTDQQLGGYLRGQFFDAAIIGLLAIIALWLLDVRYFILIGIFAGLANMIPYVGPLTGAVTAIIVVLINGGSGQQVFLVALAFTIIQLLDNVLVQPLVVARTVNLHPLLIIFAVIIGGQFFGILGMLLAVPVTGMIKVFSVELYKSFRKYRVV